MWIIINKKPINILYASITEIKKIETYSVLSGSICTERIRKELYKKYKNIIDMLYDKYMNNLLIEEINEDTIEDKDNYNFGYYYMIIYKDPIINEKQYISSSLFDTENEANKSMEELLLKFNKIYSDLEKIEI